MNENLIISFSEGIVNFEEYFKRFDKSEFKGQLQKRIDSGKFVWIEDNELLASKNTIDSFKTWMINFEKLIDISGIECNSELLLLKEFLNTNKQFHIFNDLVKLDPDNSYGFSVIIFFFNKILKQSFYYIDMVDQFGKGYETDQLIFYKHSFLNSKIYDEEREFSEMVISFRNNLLVYIKKNDTQIKELLNELLYATETFLTVIWDYYEKYSFNYYYSPLFQVYMDLIGDIQGYLKLANSHSVFPLITKYFKEIERYGDSLKIEHISKKIVAKKEVPTLIEMFENPLILKSICNILIEKEFVKINSSGKYFWRGNPLNRRAKKSQLVALSLVCDKFLNDAYMDKDIHLAFTSFFNIKTSNTIFKDSKVGDSEKYKSLFSFVYSL